MGKKEEPMIAYYEDARHFAWLVNGWICQGEKEIDEALIKPKNIRLTGKTGSGRTTRMRSRYRDVFKEIGKVKIVLMIGTELQSFVDYSMPVRVMDYDALEYKDQIQKIASERKTENAVKSGKKKVALSPIKKEDRLILVITLVLYMGEEPWNAAKNLHGLLDFSEVPERFKTYIPDYQIHVLDVCHTPDAVSYTHLDVYKRQEIPAEAEMHTGKYAVKDITSQILTPHRLHHFICCKKSYYGLCNKLDYDGYDYAKSYCDHQCIACLLYTSKICRTYQSPILPMIQDYSVPKFILARKLFIEFL